MKLIIKTKDIELEYEDEYSKLENEVKDRIKEILVTTYECSTFIKPALADNPTLTSTAAATVIDKLMKTNGFEK